MRRTLLIFGREFQAMLTSPVVLGLVALTWFICGVFFRWSILPSTGGDIRAMVEASVAFTFGIEMIFVPLLTMRLLAEERRVGTFETLVTTPARDHEIVLGKFLAAFLVNSLTWLVVPFWFLVVKASGGDPDFGTVWGGWIGLVATGALFTGIGVFASSLTQHQILAGFLGVVLIMVFTWLPALSIWLEEIGLGALGEALLVGNLSAHVQDSSFGIVDGVFLAYTLAFGCVMLVFATRVLESRKWR